jgi:energy-coupling factor transporter ATP-binding protein EcfA2
LLLLLAAAAGTSHAQSARAPGEQHLFGFTPGTFTLEAAPSVKSARTRGHDELFSLPETRLLRADAERASAALADVGLSDDFERHPRDLSAGERERLALAGVLVGEPDPLVLDEPTKGADPPRKRALAEFLRATADRRATLVVTHDLDFARSVADRQVALGDAREVLHV